MLVDLEWLRREAANQGLSLTDEDLEVIRQKLHEVKTALATLRLEETTEIELGLPYRFAGADATDGGLGDDDPLAG